MTASRSMSNAPRTDRSASSDWGGRRSMDTATPGDQTMCPMFTLEGGSMEGGTPRPPSTDRRPSIGIRGWIVDRSVHAADDPHELALDAHVRVVLGRVLVVGRLETDPALLPVEALERDRVLLHLGDHDVPVARRLLRPDDHEVPVRDVGVHH